MRPHFSRTTGALLFVVVALLPLPLTAQGTAEDYRRSREMGQRVRGKVLNADLELHWISESEAIYRQQTASDRWQYMRVDASKGTRAVAFDHKRLARALKAELERDVDPQRLPLQLIPRSLDSGERHTLLFLYGDRVFEWGEDLQERPIEEIGALRLAPQRIARSRDTGGAATVHVINTLKEPVEFLWLDRGGSLQPYATVQPGGRYTQGTFAGHAWRLRSPAWDLPRTYVARGPVSIILLTTETEETAAAAESNNAQSPSDHRNSPDGKWRATIVDYNVHLTDRSKGESSVITDDGTTEDRYQGPIRWSADSQKVAFLKVIPGETHIIHRVDSSPDDRVQPKLQEQRYRKPGDRIDQPRPRIFDVSKGQWVPTDDALWPNPWSLTRLEWSADGSEFRFLYNARGHRVMQYWAISGESGKARLIIDEQPETFFDYAQKLTLRPLGDETAVWMSERSGWNHLYRVTLDQTEKLQPITQGEWVVRSVEDIDLDKEQIIFRALGVYPEQDPYYVHYGRVNFDGSGLTWLTSGDGTHSIDVKTLDQEHYVDRYSRADLPPIHELRRSSDGSLVVELERADWRPLLATGWQPPIRFVAPGRNGKTPIYGLIYLPSNFNAETQYPVVEDIYAGPHNHFVPKSFRSWARSREVAELGFVVVRIDGMGTNWRSKAFHDVCWKNLADAGLPDRIAWLRAAQKSYPYLDLERVGIYGGSAGGQSALSALLSHGDFYDVAVADCGCHDNRMDKIWWNELWMSWPIGPHYAEQSNVTRAHQLEGELLLIVGELDSNVDPASTLQVVDALIAADKDFEFLLMTGVGHGAAETAYGNRRRKDFLVRKLLGVEPRR